MSKAEKFIRENTSNCCNVCSYNSMECSIPWLTPGDARKAVEIAREEIYEWLKKKRKILEAEEELEKWENLRNNLEKAQKLYDEQYTKNMQYNATVNEERKEIEKRYNTVLEKVKAWDIPIEYNSLKELMLKQLKESIECDCSPYTPYKEEKVPIEEWIEVRIRLAKRDLDYHTKEFQEEKRRIAEHNNYLKGLYDALDKVEPLT